MSEYYNRHNRLASACPWSNLSPVFVPSIKRASFKSFNSVVLSQYSCIAQDQISDSQKAVWQNLEEVMNSWTAGSISSSNFSCLMAGRGSSINWLSFASIFSQFSQNSLSGVVQGDLSKELVFSCDLAFRERCLKTIQSSSPKNTTIWSE